MLVSRTASAVAINEHVALQHVYGIGTCMCMYDIQDNTICRILALINALQADLTSWLTHLCWVSRTSPCHVSLRRCVTALWRTRWRWSYTGGSPQRKSYRSSRRTPSLALWELAAWRPNVACYLQGFEGHQVHAEKRKTNVNVLISNVLCWYSYII